MITSDFTGNFGNHIWQYAVTRAIAKKKNLEWGFTRYIYGDYFGGKDQMDFLDLDYGKPVENIINIYEEKYKIYHHVDGVRIYLFDNFENLQDNTKLFGCWQSEKYFIDIKDEVKDWIQIKKNIDFNRVILNDNTCVINVRGGEYIGLKPVLINQKYWDDSVAYIKSINSNVNFLVITDDVTYSRTLFPNFECVHYSIAEDYYAINKAKYLILSNSSFAYFPAWLNTNAEVIIAPKYWARFNVSDGYWANSFIMTEGWTYMDREGNIQNYDQVIDELKNSKYKEYFF